jgi:hypothetical protein
MDPATGEVISGEICDGGEECIIGGKVCDDKIAAVGQQEVMCVMEGSLPRICANRGDICNGEGDRQ